MVENKRGKKRVITQRDVEVAEFQGKVIEKLETIEEYMAESKADIVNLKEFQTRQKAYLAMAIFLGGLIVTSVNLLLDIYTKAIKK